MKKEVGDRRASMEMLVREGFAQQQKPITVTQMFHYLNPDAPEGKESIQKWNDINRAILKMTNDGELVAHKTEGKRRVTFSLSTPKEADAPSGENGEGI